MITIVISDVLALICIICQNLLAFELSSHTYNLFKINSLIQTIQSFSF